MKNKVVFIDKCQDCKYSECKLRCLVGSIPLSCPLFDIDSLNETIVDHYNMIEKHDGHILGIK